MWDHSTSGQRVWFPSFRVLGACLATAVIIITTPVASFSTELPEGWGRRQLWKKGGFPHSLWPLGICFFHFSEQKEDCTLILILYSGFLSVYMMYHFLSFYFYQSVPLYLNWISFRYSIPDSYIFIHFDVVFNNLKFNVYIHTFYHLAVCILYIPSVLCPSFLL